MDLQDMYGDLEVHEMEIQVCRVRWIVSTLDCYAIDWGSRLGYGVVTKLVDYY